MVGYKKVFYGSIIVSLLGAILAFFMYKKHGKDLFSGVTADGLLGQDMEDESNDVIIE